MKLTTQRNLLILALVFFIGYGWRGSEINAQYAPTPVGEIQPLDNNGHILPGGKLCSYQAGTTTPQATYRDAIGTANTNPVILNSAGRATVYLNGQSYKFVLLTAGTDGTCSTGTTLWTMDNISIPGLISNSITIPAGQSFTMQPGSTSSIGTNFYPDQPGLRFLGTAGKEWAGLNTDALTVTGPTALSGTLTQSSASTFSGAVGLSGTTTLTGGLTCNGPMTLSNSTCQVTGYFVLNGWGLFGLAGSDISGGLLSETGTVMSNGSFISATNPSNAVTLRFDANGASTTVIASEKTGSGSYQPITFYLNGGQQVVFHTNGDIHALTGSIYSDTGYLYSPLIQSMTGQRYVCVTTTGQLVSSASACSGT